MVCMDGFILTHAVRGASICPSRTSSTPSSRPTNPARFSTRTTRSPSAPWWDRRPSKRSVTSHTCASSTRWIASPPSPGDFAEYLRPGERGASAQLPDRGCRDDRRRARFGPRHDKGRRRRAPSQPVSASVSSGSRRSGPFPTTQCATPSVEPGGSSSSRRPSASDSAACSRPTLRWRRTTRTYRSTRWSPGSAGGQSRNGRLSARSRTPPTVGSSRLTFLDLDHGMIERERARITGTRRSGPSAENVLRDLGTVASRIG